MKKVAVLVENKFEEPELIYPYWRLKEDYEVVLVGTQADTEYVGKAGGYKMKSDISSSDAKASDFDAVYILSLIHISEPTRPSHISRMPSSA